MTKSLIRDISLVTASIEANGSPISGTYQLLSILVVNEINKIPYAKIILADGGVAEADSFKISNSNDFVPGAEIVIKAGYKGNNQEIFTGIVIKHSLKIKKGEGGSELTIECKHKAIKMTVGRKNQIYVNKKDSDIITEIFQKNGIDKTVETTDFKHKELVQHYATDWDFVLMRADINGMIVLAHKDKLTVQKPEFSTQPVLSVKYGETMLSFNGEIDARTQLSSVESNSWESGNIQTINAKGNKPDTLKIGNLSSQKLSSVINLDKCLLQSSAYLPIPVLDKWATAKLTKAQLSLLRGNVSFQGEATVKTGDLIKIEGLSDRFNGNGFVGGVIHKISKGEWITEITLGMSDNWYHSETPEVDAPITSGVLPAIHGLALGIVTKIHEDPDGNYRIFIKLPLISEEQEIPARLSSFYASKDVGAFFYPEIGDEVIVGFLNESPDNPIILGSLFGKKNKPPLEPNQENSDKAIITNSKLKLNFNDKDIILTIETPAAGKVVLDDKDKKIVIEDQNGNKLEMSSSGITIESSKDIKMKASGNIAIEATQKVEIKATSDFQAEGLNVKCKANAQLSVEGSATAELKSGGQTVVKGAIVMIN